jgi:hypothetical protein
LFANCQALTGGFRAWVAAIMIVPMILEALLAMTVEYGTPTPQLNPAICANVRRVSVDVDHLKVFATTCNGLLSQE